MGGCCCSTRNSHMNGTPTYFYCPIAMEERTTSEINSGSSSMLLNAGHDHLNLDFPIPNTYRSPPTPLPYNVVLTYPQQKDPNSAKERICGCSLKTTSAVKSVEELDRKSQDSGPSRKLEHSKLKGNSMTTPVTEEDQDVCPICLEEYDSVHPEIITKCKHHFHLACLLEWTERSNVCPICDKVLTLMAVDNILSLLSSLTAYNLHPKE